MSETRDVTVRVTEEVIAAARVDLGDEPVNQVTKDRGHETKFDIVNRWTCSCPIARAIRPLLAEGYRVMVGLYVYIGREGQPPVWDHRLDSEALHLMETFDRGETPEPIEFELEGVPACVLKEWA